MKTGIPQIDEYNQGFEEVMKQVQEYSITKNYDRLPEVISELEMLSLIGFPYEEELLKNSGVSNLEAHLEQHGLFKAKVKQFKLELEYLNPSLSDNLLVFMKKWYLSHIQQVDSIFVQIQVDENGEYHS